MKRLPLLLLLLGGTLHAQTAEELQIEKRSAFTLPEAYRNPFLPIGWKKPEPQKVDGAATTPAKSTAISTAFFQPQAFAITSISTGTPRVAVINGKIYTEGETITRPVGNQIAQIRVAAIRDGVVTLSFAGRSIEVPLRSSAPAQTGKPDKP